LIAEKKEWTWHRLAVGQMLDEQAGQAMALGRTLSNLWKSLFRSSRLDLELG
jgi:hypothetical protein